MSNKPDFWEGYVPEPVKPRGEATLAQQEPVAYPEGDVVGPCICGSWPGGKCLKCPRITAPAQQEPVAWEQFYPEMGKPKLAYLPPTESTENTLYTSPPAQRTWVGLTNNELQPIADEYRILFGSWVEDFARAIEAKLRSKNEDRN